MPNPASIPLRDHATLTLPEGPPDRHRLKEGDALHPVDSGGGAFVITPVESRIPESSRALEQIREEEGVFIDELLSDLREDRQKHADEAA